MNDVERGVLAALELQALMDAFVDDLACDCDSPEAREAIAAIARPHRAWIAASSEPAMRVLQLILDDAPVTLEEAVQLVKWCRSPPIPEHCVSLDDSGEVEVRGTRFYRPALHELVTQGRTDRLAELVPEPNNRWDANAIVVRIGGRCVGHIPRDLAPAYRAALSPLTEAGRIGVCSVAIAGGDGTGPYRVTLKLGPPDRVAELLSQAGR